MDGDGSIMIGLNHKGMYTKPRLSILGTEQFLISLIAKMGWKMPKLRRKGNIYMAEWGGLPALNYMDELYNNANIYLDRKYEKYLTLKRLNNNLPLFNEN